jgi:hypothetical protein
VILSPLPTHRPRQLPVGILKSSGEIESEEGAKILYCENVVHALRMVRKNGGHGIAIRSPEKYRWLRIETCGLTIYPVGVKIDLGEAILFRDYCFKKGISARSIQGMGFYLLRQSLSGPTTLEESVTMPTKLFPSGAFTLAVPGVHSNLYQSDIRGAYLHSLGTIHHPVTYTEVRRIALSELAQYDAGFALVSFRSRHPYTPKLGTKGATVFEVSPLWSTVLLSTHDLRVALSMGTDLRLKRAWVPVNGRRIFASFLDEMTTARASMPTMAKLASNSVWGSFVAGSTVKRIEFKPGGGTITRPMPPRSKLCPPLAFSVIASLRERIIMEGIGTGTVQAHTDGILSDRPIETGDSVGDWRIAGKVDEACVVRPACYSVTVNGETTYKVSGHSGGSERLRRMFRERIEYDTTESSYQSPGYPRVPFGRRVVR